MAHVQTECVLVVPTALFCRLGYFQGFSADVERYLPELFSPEHTSYRPRHEVEKDPSFKQLIPYVIFRYRDEQGRRGCFNTRAARGRAKTACTASGASAWAGTFRPKTSTANAGARGGRLSRGDAPRAGRRGGDRHAYTERCVGLINDDQTEVGRVHLGVVHLVDVEPPKSTRWKPISSTPASGRWTKSSHEAERLESWSQICLEALFGER